MSKIDPNTIDIFTNYLIEAYNDAQWISDNVLNEYDVEEYINNKQEYHYFKVRFKATGKANFYIKACNDSNLYLYVFDKDGLKIASAEAVDKNKQLCHSVDIQENEVYLIGIKCNKLKDLACKYNFRTKLYDTISSYKQMLQNLGLIYKLPASYSFSKYGSRTLKHGTIGTDVVHLQRLLKKLSYLETISYTFDLGIQTVVKAFQNDNYLVIDGLVGPNTRKALEYRLEEKRIILSGKKLRFITDINKCHNEDSEYKIAIYDEDNNLITTSEESGSSSDEKVFAKIKLKGSSPSKILRVQLENEAENDNLIISAWDYDSFCISDKIADNVNWQKPTSRVIPVKPRYMSEKNNRLANAYSLVIDQLNVEINKRYEPQNGKTYCNIYAWDVTVAMDAEIPHWVTNKDSTPYKYDETKSYNENTKIAHELNANSLYLWMETHHQEIGYQQATAEEAQIAANKGEPAVAMWYNQSGQSGHIQIVRPTPNKESYDHNKGVYITQAGRENYKGIYLREVYSKSYQSSLKYYAHR